MTIMILALMFDMHIPIEKRRQSESTQWYRVVSAFSMKAMSWLTPPTSPAGS